MRILVHHIVYRPEAIGNGTYTGELCEWLAKRGHEVRVVCPPPYYPHWRVQPGYSAWRYMHETIAGVGVFRCPIFLPSEPRGIKRLAYSLGFVIFSFPVMLWMSFWRPDVVLVIEPSFLNSLNALLVARLSRRSSWLHIQDFEIDIALAMGMAKSRPLIAFAHAVESFLMRRFDVVSTISGRMLAHLTAKRVDTARCRLVPNWVDPSEIFPQVMSPMRTSLKFCENDIVALFSGTMGAKQGVEIIIEAAMRLTHRRELKFLICGDGASVAGLKAMAADLPNVSFLPLQPLSKLNDLLNVADIHLLPQKSTAEDLVMPSKLLGMVASGRPIIATVNPGTEVANSLQTCGIITPPGDVAALASAVLSLADDPARRQKLGSAAREFALMNLSVDKILARFEDELMQLVGRTKPASASAAVESPGK